jgi:hypothetical protein
MLELAGHTQPALNLLGLGAAAIETLVGYAIETARDEASEPLRSGATGLTMRTAGLLSGPLPLFLRLVGMRSKRARRVAAAVTIAGSLVTRFAWVEAGKASAAKSR